ncbi:MAG: ATP-binding protein [Bryobacteraceae bacterium]
MANHKAAGNATPPSRGQEEDKGSEARLERRFRHLLEAAPDAILEIDRDGRIVLMNAATERLFGYSREELAGQNVDILAPDEARIRHAHHRADYSSHPLPRPMGGGLLLQGQRKDGTRFPVEISLSPFESDEGFRVGAIIRDVTDRVKAEERIGALQARYTGELTAANRQLAIRNREVEAANQLKSEFLASMSHELRTPLHTIIGFAELLSEGLEGSLGEKQLRFVNHILRDGRHLLELINDILDLSKIEAGRLELRLEEFEWTEALADVVATIRPQALARELALSLGEVPPRRLCADRVRFKAILYNLLSNAVKFTPSGGRVWVTAVIDERTLAVSVHDTGIGISLERQTRIFDKFYQAGMTTKGIREGTGLGLAIAKHLVELHGGTITVESSPGYGSSFTLRIPLAAGDPDLAANRRTTSAAKPLLLIVQPDTPARQVLVNYLESQGYRAEAAGGPDEALSKARNLNPDAIALDLTIAGADGWTTLRELRRTPETAGILVLIVSIMEKPQGISTAGAAAYLVKPVDPGILLAALRRHVHTHPGNPSKLLVVDDERQSRQLLQGILGGAGYVPILTSGGREALDTLAKTEVSAAIVALRMPEMDGVELISRVREHPGYHELPILAMTPKELSALELEVLRRDTRAVLLQGTTSREDLVSELRRLVPTAWAAGEG